MTSLSTVSVIIPSYNHAAYIEDAIRSVACQATSGFDIEIIVIDDGSSDNSPQILRSLLAQEKYQFKLIEKSNEGLCRTLNRGIRDHATGAWIAILASDDMWRADKLKLQFEKLRRSADCEVCYSNAETIGSGTKGRLSSTFMFEGDVKRALTLFNFIPAGSIVFTRRLFDAAGGFDETGLKLEDWDFLLRASTMTCFCCVKEDLLLYRVHSEGSLIKMRRAGTLFDEKMKVLEKNVRITSPFLRFVSTLLHFGLDRIMRPLMYKVRGS